MPYVFVLAAQVKCKRNGSQSNATAGLVIGRSQVVGDGQRVEPIAKTFAANIR